MKPIKLEYLPKICSLAVLLVGKAVMEDFHLLLSNFGALLVLLVEDYTATKIHAPRPLFFRSLRTLLLENTNLVENLNLHRLAHRNVKIAITRTIRLIKEKAVLIK